MKYALYPRKSLESDERQQLSIASQVDNAKQMFGDLDMVVMQESKSASKLPDYANDVIIRPVFNEMINLIKRGKIQGIIAWHPDRLSRNEIDAATITSLVRTGVIKDLKFCSYEFNNSPEGIMMLQMALSQSQYFSSKLGKDVTRGMTSKAESGEYPSKAPLGYLNKREEWVGGGRPPSKIIIDPDRFLPCRQIWDWVLCKQHTISEIEDLVYDSGLRTPRGKKINKSQTYNMLSNTFYYGSYEWPKGSGNWHKGTHKPMVTIEEYNRVQTILGRGTTQRPQRHNFTYTNHLTCKCCGGAVTASQPRKLLKDGHSQGV